MRKLPRTRSLELALVLARSHGARSRVGNDGGRGALGAQRGKKTNQEFKLEATRPTAWVWINGGAPCCAIGGGPGVKTAYLDCRPAQEWSRDSRVTKVLTLTGLNTLAFLTRHTTDSTWTACCRETGGVGRPHWGQHG